MQEIYGYIEECDNIIIASPIYFSELTGRFLDVASRLQTYYCARHLRNEEPVSKPKKGGVLLVGGGDGDISRAYGTACTVLHQMNCDSVFEPVVSHHTNVRPAAEDNVALEGIKSLARFLNGD